MMGLILVAVQWFILVIAVLFPFLYLIGSKLLKESRECEVSDEESLAKRYAVPYTEIAVYNMMRYNSYGTLCKTAAAVKSSRFWRVFRKTAHPVKIEDFDFDKYKCISPEPMLSSVSVVRSATIENINPQFSQGSNEAALAMDCTAQSEIDNSFKSLGNQADVWLVLDRLRDSTLGIDPDSEKHASGQSRPAPESAWQKSLEDSEKLKLKKALETRAKANMPRIEALIRDVKNLSMLSTFSGFYAKNLKKHYEKMCEEVEAVRYEGECIEAGLGSSIFPLLSCSFEECGSLKDD